MAEEVIREYTKEPSDMQAFRESAYYQSLGIEPLQQMVDQYAKGDDALRAEAEAQYRPTYEREVEAIRQARDEQALGYRQQMDAMAPAYERQRRLTDQAYRESEAQLGNMLTKRGLGRSSLVSTQGAYLQNQRNQALADIDREEKDALEAINERIALLTSQAAQSERTLSQNYAQQLESRINELKRQNQTAAVSLQLQIAALQQQGYEAYQKWLLDNRAQVLDEKVYDAEYAPRTSSSSSGSSKKGNVTVSTAPKADVQETAKKAASAISSMLGTVKNGLGNLLGGGKKSGGGSGNGGTAGKQNSFNQLLQR